MKLLTALLVAATSIHSVYTWGDFGHETIGFIAQDFVSSETAKFIKNLLNDDSTTYMAGVATWADKYRETGAGQWSAPLHFIDANDHPLTHDCNIDFQRDCGENGCVVGAIMNYTSQVLDSSTDPDEAVMAMKFIIHFVGDVHQPCHDEALLRGLNNVHVTWHNKHNVHLHAVWDVQIPEKLAGVPEKFQMGDVRKFATSLSTAIKSRSFDWDPSSWISGMNLDDMEGTIMGWAAEANQFICTDVIPDGYEILQPPADLSTDYYAAHVAVARVQIARAGYRLAAWLNLMAARASSRMHIQDL